MTALHAYPIARATHHSGWRRDILDTRIATVAKTLRLGQEAASALITDMIDGGSAELDHDGAAYRLTMCGITGGYGTGALAVLTAWHRAAVRN
jgi:hypothetical protein